ncbi:MAG TPA: ABC transporter permease [Solirubrobacteraceae bacterium]|nr:ABC transporter permease [Solirubrobacteraceae bacterium]
MSVADDPLSTADDPLSTGPDLSSSVRRRRLRFVAGQLLFVLATLFVISLVMFFAVNLGQSPRDVARQALGHGASIQALNAYAHAHGLDAPVIVRYGRWLGDFVQGNWGVSAVTGTAVRPSVVPELGRTFALAAITMLIALPISLWLGVMMARRYGRRADLSVNVALVVLSAMPEFVVGIVVLLIFSVWLGLLPPNSTALVFGDLSQKIQSFILPVLTLVLVSIPYLTRVTRVAAREALLAPYARAATLRGVSRRSTTWNHAMRNAAVPIANAVALNFIYLLGGVIVVENLFGFPGAGQALVQAIGNGDVITVEAIGLVMGAAFVLVSVLTDTLVVYFNPRLRAGR